MGSPPAGRPAVETVLIAAVVVLCSLSVVMVYSASSVYAQKAYGNTWAVLARHSTYVVLGAALLVLAVRVPLPVWRDRLAGVLLVASFAALAVIQLPGTPFAPEVNGASRWIRLGPLGFQPSDLAKLALVLWLARLLARHQDEIGTTALLKRALYVFVPLAALVMLGNDLGTTVLLGLIFVAMWFLAGAPLGQVGTLGAGMLGAALLAMTLLEGFRVSRVMAFINPSEHTSGTGYQTLQSQIGFATGGFWGAGPGASRAKWGFLPEAHTDFILAVIGEELGVIGTVAVIASLAAVVACGIVIGVRSKDPFGRSVAFGISTWLAVQALVNVMVSVGAMPTKGIPLPFVSYGGTAMVMSMLAVGVLLAVSRAVPPARPARATRPPAQAAPARRASRPGGGPKRARR